MAGDDAALRRAHELGVDAGRAGEVAAALDELSREVERGLDPVLARMGPDVWAGGGARRADAAASEAREDLRMAAGSLREVAQDLRVLAATLTWRAEDLRVRAGAPR